jgi:branched-chain amino acid transport system substrate-binding protein
MRRRGARALAAVGSTVAVLVAAGCGGGGEAIRIGVLTDCVGLSAGVSDAALGAAELPLLERGARLAGRTPGDGVEGARVAGRRVELLRGCTENGNYARLIEVARRLIEKEHADILVGPVGEGDGVVLRDVAARHPGVTVVLALSDAQESTLQRPAPNVFRFLPDGAQAAAGLGAYAYHVLGWRTAALIGTDNLGWPQAAGFVAEFCALGGRVVDRRWFTLFDRWPRSLAAAISPDADGVALFPAFTEDWIAVAKAYGKLRGGLSRRVVLGPGTFPENAKNLARSGAPFVGAATVARLPFDSTPGWARIRREVARRLPALPPLGAPDTVFLAYYDAAEAAVQALERVGGDLSDGGRSFRAALGQLVLRSPTGPIRLDAARQAVARGYLGRVGLDGAGKPVLRPLRVLDGVEQTFNGYFTRSTPGPSRTSPACRRAKPPPWAVGS